MCSSSQKVNVLSLRKLNSEARLHWAACLKARLHPAHTEPPRRVCAWLHQRICFHSTLDLIRATSFTAGSQGDSQAGDLYPPLRGKQEEEIFEMQFPSFLKNKSENSKILSLEVTWPKKTNSKVTPVTNSLHFYQLTSSLRLTDPGQEPTLGTQGAQRWDRMQKCGANSLLIKCRVDAFDKAH